MAPTTEICILDLVAGSDVGDPNNAASGVLKDSGDTLVQQDGMQQMQFGTQVEHPEKLSLFLNWDNKRKHEQFMAADAYKPFLDRFKTIFTGTPDIKHVDLEPEGGLTAALSAPVTEVATFFFDGEPGPNAFENVKKCAENLEAGTGVKLKGWSWGVTHETLEKDGVKGKAAVLTIGWSSVQEHMDVRASQTFKDNIHLIRGEAKGIEMHHVAFMNFVPTS